MRTALDYDRHARALAARHGVTLEFWPELPPDLAAALPAVRTVVARTITEETSYAVVVHEIGHIVDPAGSQRGGPIHSIADITVALDEEDAAWRWARRHALEWTDLMEHVAQMCRETYRQELRRQLDNWLQGIATHRRIGDLLKNLTQG